MVIKVAQQQQQQQQQMHSSSPPDLAKLNELFPSSEAYYQSMSRPKTIAKPDKIALKSMTRDEMKDWLVSIDEKPSRVEQLIESMYRRRQLSPTKAAAGEEEKDDDGNSSVSNYCNDVEDMSSEISAKFRAKMHELASFGGDLTLDSINVAKDGTRKVTYALSDGGIVESVIIPPLPGEAEEDGKKGRTTVCVSSQLGCAMNCQFCFTAKMGLRKNLNANQIVQQVVNARDIAGEDVTNVVFMGMGEPLHNTENVLKAVKIMTDPKGLNFSKNRVTVSTSGLIPGIERFLDESDCMLAVSLNATTNEIRNWIMPINRKYPLEDLLGVIRERFSNNSSGGGGGSSSSSSSSSSDERAKKISTTAKSLLRVHHARERQRFVRRRRSNHRNLQNDPVQNQFDLLQHARRQRIHVFQSRAHLGVSKLFTREWSFSDDTKIQRRRRNGGVRAARETGGSSKLEAATAENETAKKYVHLMRLDYVTRIFDSYFTTSMKFYTIHFQFTHTRIIVLRSSI